MFSMYMGMTHAGHFLMMEISFQSPAAVYFLDSECDVPIPRKIPVPEVEIPEEPPSENGA